MEPRSLVFGLCSLWLQRGFMSILSLLCIGNTHATDIFRMILVGFLRFEDRVWIDKRRAHRTLDNIA